MGKVSVASLAGMTEPFVERRIREAIERGELEPREGVGEPIPNLDQDPDWWVKSWVERENLKDDLRRGRAPRREGPRDPKSVLSNEYQVPSNR